MSSVSHPSSRQIAMSQDSEQNIRRQLAARTVYLQGKWVYFGGASLALLLALVSPLVLVFWPDLGPLLGAVAGLWVFVSRLVFEPLRLWLQEKGARLQEMFDCDVLGLSWNDALVQQASGEEVRTASKNHAKSDKVRGWYPDPAECAWPTSVLVCQRANAVWARRQHRGYAVAVVIAATAWFIVGVVVATTQSATLAQYLTTIALPSLPALLDASDVARGHWRAADARSLLEARTNALLDHPADVDDQDLREIQDQLYNLRAEAPLVPEWFYKAIRGGYEADMRYAADQVAEETSRGD